MMRSAQTRVACTTPDIRVPGQSVTHLTWPLNGQSGDIIDTASIQLSNTMIYCSNCGARVVEKIPAGDDRARFVCETCATIHYQNPKIVAGCIPEWNGRLLLCRRAIEPRLGLWTLPAGFMENLETTEQAAARETWEEARARVVDMSLYGVFSIPHISQVYMMFRARLQAEEYAPGPESLDVRLFDEHEIPWDELAFPVVRLTLEKYYQDINGDGFPVHVEDINRHVWRKR